MNPLNPYRDQELDAAGLARAASELLALRPVPADERVRALPDVRTLRYYQSTQLLDRPTRYAGRRAMYGFRHLLQVLAVKLLQSQGRSLASIQTGLAGRTNTELEAALLPAFAPDASPPPAPQELRTVRLAPGVLVTLDPACVQDIDQVIDALRAALPPTHR